MSRIWHTPSYVELSPAAAAVVRQALMMQAFRARECYSCLAPLRDPAAVYCCQACADEMSDHPGAAQGLIDRAPSALVIHLPLLATFARRPERQLYAA